jgi:hypothetical protein
MGGTFYNVSGVDTTEEARVVFVWWLDRSSGNRALLGSGHVLNVGAGHLPPGIRAGQFSVTFLLPPRRAADDIVVTDDTNSDAFLPDVTVTPCAVSAPGQSGAAPAPRDPATRAGTTDTTSRPRNSGQLVMARDEVSGT